MFRYLIDDLHPASLTDAEMLKNDEGANGED